jgi:hypothetical protein
MNFPLIQSGSKQNQHFGRLGTSSAAQVGRQSLLVFGVQRVADA